MFIWVDCSTADGLFAASFPSTAQAGVHEFAALCVSLRDDNDADLTRIGLVTCGQVSGGRGIESRADFSEQLPVFIRYLERRDRATFGRA